jgi:hypothetical protein
MPEAEAPPVEVAPSSEMDSTNNLSKIVCVIRSVNLGKKSPTANSDLAYSLQSAFVASPIFGEGSALSGGIEQVDDSQPTVGLNMTLKLKRPLKF